MTVNEQAALIEFARSYGWHWKRHLADCWQRGSYPGTSADQAALLRGLRNVGYFGPQGLIKYQLPR